MRIVVHVHTRMRIERFHTSTSIHVQHSFVQLVTFVGVRSLSFRVVNFTTNVHRVVARRDRRNLVAMARRYDSRTTIFSPEGRLYQVEYAMEAIGHAGACVGVLAQDGIVLAAEKKITSKVRDKSQRATNVMFTMDANVAGRNV